MDPLTHGLSGALAARALLPRFPDERLDRVARWAVVLGSIFPDIDVIAKPFDPDDLATIRVHRTVTHSLVCLPVWAFLLAALAVWFCRRRRIPAPRLAALTLLFGFGIGLHILFDCITSFGTLVWSPISWTRVSWDWTFIVDLALTGVLLYFLLLGWVAGGADRRQSAARSAVLLALVGGLATLYLAACYAFTQPLAWSIAAALYLATAAPLCFSLAGPGRHWKPQTWWRIGVLATAAYLALNAQAHQRALLRVRSLAAAQHLDVREAAAIPLPPNLNAWSGFARTPQGTTQWTISLAAPAASAPAPLVVPAVSGAPCPDLLWTLAQVRAWMRFARFPAVQCREDSTAESAQFTDLRFLRPPFRWESNSAREKPIPFTWRISFDGHGRVTRENWVVQ
ncbi:MAG TPA: metal-dependent hydrolase [Candidatus Binatia bacterium]|nr:metal-dependent hydrolase [Candidatus Binatia bacterium]